MNHAYKHSLCTLLDNVYRKMSRTFVDYQGHHILQAGEYTCLTFGKCYLNPGVYCDEYGIFRNIFTKKTLQSSNNNSDLLLQTCRTHANHDEKCRILVDGADTVRSSTLRSAGKVMKKKSKS